VDQSAAETTFDGVEARFDVLEPNETARQIKCGSFHYLASFPFRHKQTV
jgi:hypothetical protein